MNPQPSPRPVAAVAVRGLVKRYKGEVGVLGVDLLIATNEVFGLVGPNGAGKTTLLFLICGLARPDQGTIELSGRFALCPDAPEFEPWLTGAEVLVQSFSLAQPKARLDPARLSAVLAETGVAPYAQRRCGGYSRGMTQRLGIAAALITDPDVLVLDEPTSALDAAGRADVLALIRDLSAERTVVLSSHALADVERTADRIAVMDAGRLLFTGAPRTLIDEHLRPAWRVRLAQPADEIARRLSCYPWVEHVELRSGDELDVRTSTVAAGERHLVPALAELGARVVGLMLLDADLESAFFALTGRTPPPDPR